MKRMKWLAAGLFLGVTVACGGDANKDSAKLKTDSIEMNVSEEPMSDMEQTSQITFKQGNHEYIVSVHRYADKALPLIVDELEQQYYDNSVEIDMKRDGKDFMKKTFTKEIFSEFLSENDYKNGIFLGMNCDTARCDRNTICFTAQVGQAGEGPAFLVLVPTDGSSLKVQRDNQQEEIGYK